LAQARAHDRGGLLSPVGGTFSPSFFFTFAADSAVELRALAGDVVLHNDAAAIAGSLEGGGFPLPGLARTGNGAALLTAAPTLRAAALSGDVLVQRAFPLLPSPQGNLELLAARDVVLDDAAVILLSDFDPARLPGPAQPAVGFSSSIARALTPSGTPPADASLRAGVPVHRGDPTVARIVARDGDVRMLTGNANPLLNLSKPVRVVAGRDVTDLRLLVQHPDGDDVTEIAAGRDVLFSVTRNAFGGIQQSARGIVVDGSGVVRGAVAAELQSNVCAALGVERVVLLAGDEDVQRLGERLWGPMDVETCPDRAHERGTSRVARRSARTRQWHRAVGEDTWSLSHPAEQILRAGGVPRDASLVGRLVAAELEQVQRPSGLSPDAEHLQPLFIARAGGNADQRGAVRTEFPPLPRP